VGVGEGAKKGIGLRPGIVRERAARGIRVKNSGAMAGSHEGVPESALARRGSGALDGRLGGSGRKRADGRGRFRGEFGLRGRSIRQIVIRGSRLGIGNV